MIVRRLCFSNFRNLEAGEITADSGINVIYGDNAHGKTNLLEAVWMFSGAQSFRGAKDAECIRHGEKTAKLSLEFTAQGRQQTAEICFAERKTAALNGVKLQSASELAGNLRAVVFSPAHLSLVKDGPAERRRFLDLAIGQLRPKYIKLIKRYARAVQQRNSVLKDARFHTQLFDMLEVYDGEIAALGANIAAYRASFINKLSECAAEMYGGISGGRERFSVEYTCSGGTDGGEMLRRLADARNDDIDAGFTTVGPHRDDLSIMINGVSARTFGSQGQQRSAVIALKMSEAEVIYEITDERPVILLDDVMSELDESRQDYILNHIADRQVFITCCDRAAVGMLKSGACFHTENGVITKEG